MSITRIRIDPNDPQSWPEGSVDYDMLDRTTEEDIARHQREDEAEAIMDAARYARRARKRLGLSRQEFARRIHVSPGTVRNWEQGKRRPVGTARALLKILDKAPEAALDAI